MTNKLTLEDCDLEVRAARRHVRQNDELFLRLPKRIDLDGIEPHQEHPVAHYEWRNSQGSFYIPCDNLASYWPEDEKLDPFRNGFEFESDVSWSEDMCKRRGETFVLRGQHGYKDSFRRQFEDVMGETNKGKIIQAIQRSDIMYGFLQSFIGWANEFADQYGEEHFYATNDPSRYKEPKTISDESVTPLMTQLALIEVCAKHTGGF